MTHPRYMYRDFVSCCILMYFDEDTCILMYLDVSCCVSSVTHRKRADTCILMYLMCIPKCILDSFGIRVKYMRNTKIHVFSWNRTGHLRYILKYIRIHKGYMYPSGYMQDTCRIHQDTYCIGNPPNPGKGRGIVLFVRHARGLRGHGPTAGSATDRIRHVAHARHDARR